MQREGQEAGPSRPREGLALPRGRARPTVRFGGASNTSDVVDLTEDSSDEEIALVRENIVAPRAAAPPFRLRARVQSPAAGRGASPAGAPARIPPQQWRAELDNLQHRVNEHGRNVEAILGAPAPRRGREEPRPRIGLGGAVVRNGGHQINYDANRNRQRREVQRRNDGDDWIPDNIDEDDDDFDAGRFAMPGAFNGRRHQPQGPMAEAREAELRAMRRADEAHRGAAMQHNIARSAALRREMEAERRALNAEQAAYDAHNRRHQQDFGWVQRFRGLIELGVGRFGGMDPEEMEEAMARRMAGFGAQGNAPLDIDNIVAKVSIDTHPDTVAGFVNTWDAEANAPIEVDDEGDLVKTATTYLRCADCDEPLLLSSAYDMPEDRVWALRCGHMVHEGCLNAMSTPIKGQTANVTHFGANGAVLLDEEGSRKRRRTTSKKVPKPSVFRWQCPVPSCKIYHASEKKVDEEKWTQTEDAGAIAVYA